jgi:hypothetical protein
MPANTRPIYTITPTITIVSGIAAALSAANLTTGTLATNVFVVQTAGANGAYAEGVRLKAQPLTATVACDARIYLNNGGVISTAGNSSFLAELQIPATSASTTIPTPEFYIPIEKRLPASWRVLLLISAFSTGAFDAHGFGADY